MGNAIRRWLPLLAAVVVFGLAWRALRVPERHHGLRVDLEVRSAHAGTWELFYDDSLSAYDADRSLRATVEPATGLQHVVFELPEHVHRVQGLRIDPGRAPVELRLAAVSLIGPYRTIRLEADTLARLFGAAHDLKPLELDSVHHELLLHCTGEDPYFASKVTLAAITRQAVDPVRPVVAPFATAVIIAAIVLLLLRALLRPRRPRPAATAAPKARTTADRRTLAFSLVAAALAFLLGYGLANNVNFIDRAIVVEMEVKAPRADNFQVFYADRSGAFAEGYFVNAPVGASPEWQLLSFRMPADTLFRFLRIDFGDQQRSLTLRRLTLRCNDGSRTYDAAQLFDLFRGNPQVVRYAQGPDGIEMDFEGNDPFIFSDTDFGETTRLLWERSGNGPLPYCFGALLAVLVFAGLMANERLPRMLTHGRGVEWATVVVFCALLAMPLLGEWLPIQPQVADTEKRPLAEKPLLRAHSLMEFPARYSRYYGDHFAFRKMLFRWNSFFHTYGLHASSMPDNVVFGKDGYLFLIRPGVTDYYRGLPLFTEEEMARIADRLEKRKAWLAQQGIDYYLFVPPLKSTVYPDKMPDIFKPVRPTSGMDQLKAYLDQHCSVKMIDARAPLIAGRQVRDTYYTTDIHWNPWGGYIGYQVLMDRLLQAHPELGGRCLPDDYIVKADTNDQGDLAMQLALNDKLTRVTYMMVPVAPQRYKEVPEHPLPGKAFFKYRPVFTQGPDPQAPKLLMFRDSFAVYLIPYLGEHFSEAVYVWSPMFIPDIVEQEKPDIVVQEMMELFLSDLLNDKVRDNI